MHESNKQEQILAGIQETLERIHEAISIQAITTMRIYDVLISQYAETNLEDAKDLINTHDAGHLRATVLPWLDDQTPPELDD